MQEYGSNKCFWMPTAIQQSAVAWRHKAVIIQEIFSEKLSIKIRGSLQKMPKNSITSCAMALVSKDVICIVNETDKQHINGLP